MKIEKMTDEKTFLEEYPEFEGKVYDQVLIDGGAAEEDVTPYCDLDELKEILNKHFVRKPKKDIEKQAKQDLWDDAKCFIMYSDIREGIEKKHDLK